ncbi:MAG: PEP-CTERM sorting domain-containing protein, partial [Oxalobacteraceae bacterium]
MSASAAFVVVATSAIPASAATTFFTDWESQDFGSGPGFAVLPAYEGWTTLSGAGIEVQYNGIAGAPLSGENLVELDSHNNSVMGRTIDPGSYVLTFFYSDRPNVGAGSNGLRVTVDGLPSLYVVAGGQGGATTNWVQHTFSFTSSGGELRFAADGISDSFGGYVENISLAAVPEPATWALCILGFGAIGGTMRRRSSAVRV